MKKYRSEMLYCIGFRVIVGGFVIIINEIKTVLSFHQEICLSFL